MKPEQSQQELDVNSCLFLQAQSIKRLGQGSRILQERIEKSVVEMLDNQSKKTIDMIPAPVTELMEPATAILTQVPAVEYVPQTALINST